MVNEDRINLTPQDLIPKIVGDQWNDTVPMHTVLVVDALRPDGARGLHVIHDSGAPAWVLIGMLRSILADLEHRWTAADYIDDEDDDD